MISSGFFRSVAFQPRDDIGARRVLGHHHHRNAVGFERLLDVLGYARFVAGRIARVDLHQRLKMAHGFVVDFGPIGCLAPAGRSSDEQGEYEKVSHPLSLAHCYWNRDRQASRIAR